MSLKGQVGRQGKEGNAAGCVCARLEQCGELLLGCLCVPENTVRSSPAPELIRAWKSSTHSI